MRGEPASGLGGALGGVGGRACAELTHFEHHVYPGADRVTVTVAGANDADVTLFLPRAELWRLRDALSAVADELDAARRACDVGMTDSAE